VTPVALDVALGLTRTKSDTARALMTCCNEDEDKSEGIPAENDSCVKAKIKCAEYSNIFGKDRERQYVRIVFRLMDN
jgi:hypothetical protein